MASASIRSPRTAGQQVFLLLIALAGHQDVLRPPEEMRQRHRAAAKLPLHQREVEMPEPAAAHLLGEVAGVEPHLDDLALDLLRELWRHRAGALHEVFVRIDLGLDEITNRRRRSSPVRRSTRNPWHPP
jgi:hypothetical protein